MATFGPASFVVSLVFLLLLIGLLTVAMLRLTGPAKVWVGAGLGVLILVRILPPLIQGPLLGSLAASGQDAYLMLTFISSTVVQFLTLIGVGMIVFGAIRAATAAVDRPQAPMEPLAEPTDFPDGGYPGGHSR